MLFSTAYYGKGKHSKYVLIIKSTMLLFNNTLTIHSVARISKNNFSVK